MSESGVDADRPYITQRHIETNKPPAAVNAKPSLFLEREKMESQPGLRQKSTKRNTARINNPKKQTARANETTNAKAEELPAQVSFSKKGGYSKIATPPWISHKMMSNKILDLSDFISGMTATKTHFLRSLPMSGL